MNNSVPHTPIGLKDGDRIRHWDGESEREVVWRFVRRWKNRRGRTQYVFEKDGGRQVTLDVAGVVREFCVEGEDASHKTPLERCVQAR